MPYENISLTIADGIARLTIQRPSVLNAINQATFSEIRQACIGLGKTCAARVLLMTGAGRAFCSGADLSQIDASTDSLRDFANPLVETLYALPMPIVTAVNGAAAGAGCSLALAGDIVIAARSAYFMLAFARIGLVPDAGATWLIPRLIGRARALRMMMLAERISAEQAEDWGMIHSVVEDDKLSETSHQIAAQLAAGPTRAFAMMRRGVRESLERTLTESLEVEAHHQGVLAQSADFAEGVSAFLQKRKPVFTGK